MLFGIRPEAFCRSVVRGYCLTSKAWAEFEVDKVAQIQWNKQAFDALVMPPPRKRLLEALVKQQQAHKKDADMDDVVKGKGQGLIMLLTGPPGVGKTLTAESIADRLQLPLYAVSASELGDSAKAIEERFGEILRLAASWNAVLLLDEADAFLDRRVDSPEARDRNKRVAGRLACYLQ
jgi:SpoVK/Ycf46/Vps4 family AAA+-type ATPase